MSFMYRFFVLVGVISLILSLAAAGQTSDHSKNDSAVPNVATHSSVVSHGSRESVDVRTSAGSSPAIMAELRPQLMWHRISPNAEHPGGPVLYQLLFSASGTPSTLPKFDSNPRHLANSSIADTGRFVTIGSSGFMVNVNTGVVSFVNGQAFPGTVSSVTAGAGLSGGGSGGNLTLSNAGVLSLSGGGGVNVSGSTGAVTFSTTAGGDLSGTLANASVAALKGVALSSTAPGPGQVLQFNSGTWAPATPNAGTVVNIATGAGLTGGPITSIGTLSIPNSGVTNAMLANPAVTVTAGSGLTGGGSVALGATTTLNLDTTFTDGRYLQLSGGILTCGLTHGATGTASSGGGFSSHPSDWTASAFNSSTTAENQTFRWRTEPIGNNTASPSGSLNLLFSGTSNNFTPTETGLSIASSGQITFAAGQTFPGTGGGTGIIITTGAGLTGSSNPITTTGTLSIANAGVTNSMLANSAVTVSAGTGLTGGGAVALGAGTTLNLDTTFSDARYLKLSGGVVTGPVGFGTSLNSQSLVDINGTQTQSGFGELLARIAGTLNSNPGNSYSTGLGVYPTTTMTGYTNYNRGIDVSLSSTGSAIAHSVVAVNVNQPSAVTGSDCVVSFGINVPNQSAPCSTPQPPRNYGFFENGVAGTMNYFANNVGIGTATPGALLSVNGNAVINGPVGFGTTPNSQSFVDINGTQTEVSNNEVLLRIDGTLNSNPGNSYSTALGVYPTTTMTGYTNYNKGIDVSLASTGAAIAHSVVAVSVNQPSAVNGSDCVVSFGINVPNQSAPCSTPQPTRNYGFFENGVAGTMNYFAHNVGIGTPTPTGGSVLLSVNGDADKVGGGSWSTFSDGRLKNIEGGFSPGLAEVLRLNPVRYRYKEQNPLGIRDTGEHIGFVAQEVQKVIPEAVTTNDRGYLLVNNDPILWAMLNAIKEQQAVIEKQRDQIQQQLAELANIRATMEKQEVRLQALELKRERPSGGEMHTAKLSAGYAQAPVGH